MTSARLLLVFLGMTAVADAAPQPSGAVQLQDTVKLSRLVDLASEITGQPYAYGPQDLDASVTIRIPGGLTRERVPDLLAHVLASRGLTTVRIPGSPVLTVVKLEQAAGMATIGNPDGAAYVTEVIVPKHQSAKVLADAIRGVLSKPGGAVSVLGESNVLIVSDLAPRLGEARLLLDRLDTNDPTTISEVQLRHVSALQAIGVLGPLTGRKDGNSPRRLAGDVVPGADGASLLLVCPPDVQERWRELITTIDRREPSETRTYSPRFFAAKDVARLMDSAITGENGAGDDRFRVVVDELTGSLIVTATGTQHERAEELLHRLDAAERPEMPVRAFPVRNRPVSELLSTLRDLMNAGVLDSNGLGTGTDAASRDVVSAGASQSAARQLFPGSLAPAPDPRSRAAGGASQDSNVMFSTGHGVAVGTDSTPPVATSRKALSLTADESTNTLIAVGEPRLLSQLETLIKTLDVRQPQVMLEAILVSLSDSEALSLGVEIEKFGGDGDTAIKLSSLFGLSTGGPVGGTVSPGAGFSGIVLNPGDFGIVVRALESTNRGRSLSQPKLLVTNNERAVFSSVLQQPITQTTRTGSNDTTFSYGGSESAGTTISVKPQIAQGDHLVLAYSIKLSNFVGGSSNAGLPPPKQENSVDSVATIPDGHAVVVGGLDILNDSKGESRVPGLGRIPVLGELFKQRNDGAGRSRFYAFIRARILRNTGFEDLKYISGADAQTMAVPDGWPVVEPRIMR